MINNQPPQGFVARKKVEVMDVPEGFVLRERQEMTGGQIAKGVGGLVGQMVTGAVAEPLAGLSGIAGSLLPGKEGQGAEWVKNVQEALTPTPSEETQRVGAAVSEYIPDIGSYIGGQVMEATGSPALATIAHSAPTALMEVLGFKAPRVAAKLAKKNQRLTIDEIGVVKKEIENLKSDAPTTEGVTEVADIMRKEPSKVAEIAQFDEKILKAADDLGLKEIPPSVAANNAQFRDVAQGLASVPGTQAKAQYGEFLTRMADKADEIIVKGGGDLDKPAVSQRFRDVTESTLNELYDAESKLYDEIGAKIQRGQSVTPTSVRSFIDSKVQEFGGVEEMPKVYRDVYRMLYDKEGDLKAPTYAAFDQKRKDIGAAIGRRASPYSDAETSTLKGIYSKFKDDQRVLSGEFGVGDIQDAADALTIKRKALENTTTELLGKKLNKDLMPEVATKIAGLPKGNVKKFIDTVDNIPESIRGEVVVSGLNDLLKGTGADQKGFGAARFVGMMNELNRSPTAKAALYKYLPKETRRSLDNFYTLANSVYKSNKENITTGKIATFFPDQRGFINKIMSQGAATVAASKTGLVGAQAVDAVAEFLSNRTPSAVKANELIASPQFQKMMREAVRDGVHEGGMITDKVKKLESLVMKSDKYKKWADNLSGSDLATVKSTGLTNFLMQADDTQETENQNQER